MILPIVHLSIYAKVDVQQRKTRLSHSLQFILKIFNETLGPFELSPWDLAWIFISPGLIDRHQMLTLKVSSVVNYFKILKV